jgi:predicted  nucleic acid-binding Zn-ribbon protein
MMEASELLQNLRLIVRDEMAPFMERMDAGFDRVEARVSMLEARLADVEGKFDQLAHQSEIFELKQEIAMHNDRIAKLEARR